MTESYKIYTQELELRAILEVTQAINDNLPEEDLYKIYFFTLKAHFKVTKIALYVWDETWQCKVNFGTKTDFRKVPFPSQSLQTWQIETVSDTSLILLPVFTEFSLVIPVLHKNKPLAYLLLTLPDSVQADTNFIQTLTNIIIVAIENKRFARKQLAQEALNRELEIAKNVQTQLFPKNLPVTPHLQVQANYFPNQVVGGDYYDFIQLSENRFLVCIADASGKGMSAALLMSNFQAALQVLLRQTTDLQHIVHELNLLLFKNTGGERFITFFLALYDREKQTFTYINAGHNPPVFQSSDGSLIFLENGTMVLGAYHPLPFLKQTTFENINKFLLFCYTDGLTESSNANDEEFGDEQVLNFIKNNGHLPLENLHDTLMKSLSEFCKNKPFSDDVTLLSCRVE